jgi:HEPN domain-containing protein
MSKLTRNDLQELARLRLIEARLLLEGGSFAGAYYLTGLALECALKACIARSSAQYDFPELRRVQDSWNHDLNKLLGTAGLNEENAQKSRNDAQFEANWRTAKDWKVESRYERRSEQEARDIYNASTEAEHGIIPWIEEHW